MRLSIAALIVFSFGSFEFARGFEKSPILTSNKIEVRVVTTQADRLLVPVMNNETSVPLTFLAGDKEGLIKLESVSSKPQKITAHYEPENFWVFKAPKNSDGQNGAYFVLVGDKAASTGKFYSRYFMNIGGPIPDCAQPDKGYISTTAEVLRLKKGIDVELIFVSSTILRGTFDKMTPEQKASGVWFKQRIAKVEKNATCLPMIQNTSDGDGQNNIGDSEPMGPLLGILKLTNNEQSELWAVTSGDGYETHGITFVRIPGSAKDKVDRHFVFSHGL